MDGIWRSAGFSLCIFLELCMMLSSISGKLRTDTDGLVNGMDFKGGASLKEYIGEIYFKKYDSLDDLCFENFVKQEILSFSCGESERIPNILVLDRYLVGEGFHRRLFTKVRLEFPVEYWSEIQVQLCEVIFAERLPLGVFADPFELQHLQNRKVFKEAFVFGDTNLELPSFLSNRALVEVHFDIDPSNLSTGLNFTLELPLHARYQPLDDSGYSNVEFGVPDLFLHYKMDDGVSMKICISVLKDNEGERERRPKAVVWSLPSGIRVHKDVVSIVTVSSAVMSTLLIVLVALRYSAM